MFADVRPDAVLCPGGKWIELHEVEGLVPLHDWHVFTRGRLIAPDPADPGLLARQRPFIRLDLAQVAAPVRIARPELRTPFLRLLIQRQARAISHRRDAVAPAHRVS